MHRATASAGMEKIVARVSKKGLSRQDFALWLDCVLRGSWADTVRDVCKRRGLAYDAKTAPSAVLGAAAEKMPTADLQALALELALSRGLYSFYEGAANSFPETFKKACELHGIDIGELRKVAKSARSEKLEARATASSTKERKRTAKAA